MPSINNVVHNHKKVYSDRNKNHFFLPDLRRRPIVEENCRAERSQSDRGASASVSVSASAEEAHVDGGVESPGFSDTPLVPPWSCEEVCGEAERHE